MREHGVDFAINHMTVPGLGWREFIALAGRLGCIGVEFRNDLADRQLFEGAPPGDVRRTAEAAGLRIVGLSQIYPFNAWSDAVRAEVEALIGNAVACGAETISLIPRNDGQGVGNGERQANLRIALREIKPMLDAHDLIALVEPLGFPRSSLRHKAEAVEIIEALGASARYKLVHDTFHHHLAGGGPIFPQHTGIVHISGVVDRRIGAAEMEDGHRVLVDAEDRLGNVEQIAALLAGGYAGPVSFECFSRAVHALPDPEAAVAASMELVRSGLERMAA